MLNTFCKQRRFIKPKWQCIDYLIVDNVKTVVIPKPTRSLVASR